MFDNYPLKKIMCSGLFLKCLMSGFIISHKYMKIEKQKTLPISGMIINYMLILHLSCTVIFHEYVTDNMQALTEIETIDCGQKSLRIL